MALNIDWFQISIYLVGVFYSFILLALAIIAFINTRRFGASAVSAGIAFTLLLLIRIWALGFSLIIGQFVGAENLMVAFAVNNLCTTFVEFGAMGMFFKAIFFDRRPLKTSDKNSKPTPDRAFEDGDQKSPLDGRNPYSAPRN